MARIVIDLDGCLCEGGPPYKDCIPKPGAQAILQLLRSKGHTVIISTARGMKTAAGNPGLAIANIGALTMNQLEDWGFEYDELLLGSKPAGDWYVEDKSVTSLQGLLDKLGLDMGADDGRTETTSC